MAGISKWGDEDKARAWVALQANKGQIKPAARQCGIPENTVRRWRNAWRDGAEAPPDTANVAQAADDFLDDAKRVRHSALLAIEEKIESGDAKVGELNAVVGTLTDKIHVIQGEPTKRTEHQLVLPSREELAATLGGIIDQRIAAAEQRELEIEDADFEDLGEQRALPAPG